MLLHRVLLMILGTLAASLSAMAQQTPPDMQRILLPVTVHDVGGAFGSRWSTDLTIFMDTDLTLLVLPFMGCFPPPPCDNPGGPTARHTLHLGFYPTAAGDTTGSFIYVARSGAPLVSF